MSLKCVHCGKSIGEKGSADGTSRRSVDPFLSIKEVAAVTGLSESTIWRRIKDGTFPPGSLTSLRRRAWRASVIAAWAASRAADHYAEAPQPD